jgi:hypothetical protein
MRRQSAFGLLALVAAVAFMLAFAPAARAQSAGSCSAPPAGA